MRCDFEDCILCSVYQALFQGMTLMMQPLNIWSFTLALQAYTRNFPLPQLDSSAFTFRSCLPSGWTVLLFSGVTTVISERVFLDHNNFWPTFLSNFFFLILSILIITSCCCCYSSDIAGQPIHPWESCESSLCFLWPSAPLSLITYNFFAFGAQIENLTCYPFLRIQNFLLLINLTCPNLLLLCLHCSS